MMSKIGSSMRMQSRSKSSLGGLEEKMCGVGTKAKKTRMAVIRKYRNLL